MLIHKLFTFVWRLLASCDVELSLLSPLTTAIVIFVIAVALWVLYYILTHPVSKIINALVSKTATKADDILLSPKILRSICMLVIIALAAYSLPRITVCYPSMQHPFEIAARVMLIFGVTRVLLLEANAFCIFLRHGDTLKSGILVLRNILNTIILSVSALFTISTILDREPAYVISALGAMAAVLMLVFKDSILGMIAGIRLSINGMLHENDWVSVPSYNADGRVEDISLTAVKVRNWDKSVASIPPYALVTGGFVNRESMLSLGIRQIKRSILIDTTSVRHLTAKELTALSEKSDVVSRTTPTVNLSLFRRHIRQYLLNHPRRAQSRGKHPMQTHVRELEHTPQGLPIEIFMFVECSDWEEFEQLQGDIVDEIMASVDMFGLRIYQKPSGNDLYENRQTPVIHIPENIPS